VIEQFSCFHHTQKTYVSGVLSNQTVHVSSGLRPILFWMCIDDFPVILSKHTVDISVDDTIVSAYTTS